MFARFLLVWFALSAIWAGNARASGSLVKFDFPEVCRVGEKAILKIAVAHELPASSFYRTSFECGVRPEGGDVSVLEGYPDSDVVFGKAGKYECVAEAGILTKSSCGGVAYRSLGKRAFVVEVLP